MTLESESDALHERVRAFERAGGASGFDELALDIARFQAEHSPGYRRLLEARGGSLEEIGALPAVPVDAFRLTRVAVHPPELDRARFHTSGTTGAARGTHAFRTLGTYRALALSFGRQALSPGGRATVVALAPPPSEPETSSLGFMMRLFMEAFDGRALGTDVAGTHLGADAAGTHLDARAPERWLAGPAGVDVAGLRRAALTASARSEPLVVLATSFALVLLIDALAGASLPAPRGTVVMQTGGFKGRTRTLDAAELRRGVARAFGIDQVQVVGEYGMTELTSQLYEGCLPGGALDGEPGVYLEPPWIRVAAVDPATLEPVASGETGIARIVDLGNVDSAVAIVTQDLVRRRGAGIELLGRRPGAPSRGCSLSIEALVHDGHGAR